MVKAGRPTKIEASRRLLEHKRNAIEGYQVGLSWQGFSTAMATSRK
jgi:hypothetical protein